MTFGDALDALDADPLIQSAMPGEMFKVFRHYKRDEWERYCATVSDWDRERVPGHPPVARAHRHRTETHMCGIAGIIYRSGTHDIGKDMIAMLQSMKHRGPDSTGYALYGQAAPDRVVMRYKLADANDPRDFEFQARLLKHRNEVESRIDARRRRDRVGRGRDRVRVPGRRALHRRPEDAGRLHRGRAERRGAVDRQLARDREGPRRRRGGRRAVRARRVHRHARDRPRADGDRVRRRHLGRPPLLGVPVLRRRGRPQRAADELLLLAPPAGAQRPPVPVRVRLRDHRRLPGREDERGADASRRPCGRASRSWTACSRTSA